MAANENYYFIFAVMMAAILAKNRTIRNRGYDLERALRIRLVECVSQLVVFIALTFVYVGIISKNIELAIFIVLFELGLMFIYESELSIKNILRKKDKNINIYVFNAFNKNGDADGNRYHQYVISFLSYFISLLVPFFLILADLIFKILKNEYTDFPLVLNVMINEKWISIIIGMSIINILLLDKRYVLIRKDVKANQSVLTGITDEEKNQLNEWYASVDHDDKKI